MARQTVQQVTKAQVIATIESGNYQEAFLAEHGIGIVTYHDSIVGIGYLSDSLEVKNDAFYVANPDRLTAILQMWAKDHGVGHVYDPKHPEKLYQLGKR
jgi:hypothetical protein